MKKHILVVSIILTTILSTLTLPLLAQQMKGGIKGGLTMSNLYIDRDELDDENARFGFNLGLYSKFMVLETFGIQPELLFTTKGSEATYSGIIDQTVNFNLNYLEVPVLAVFRPLEVLELHAGPYVGLLLSSNIEYSGTIDGNDEIDRDNFNTLDYGIGAGVALNFGSVSAGLRYNLGFQELAKTTVAEMLLGDSKNSYGQLYIAFSFNE